jgi:2-iminoacetate synthase
MITLETLEKQAMQFEKQIADLLNKNVNELRMSALAVKPEINGLEFFAPLYVSNICQENCDYCGFRSSNKIKRITLSQSEVDQEVEFLKKHGYDQVYVLTGSFVEGSLNEKGTMTEVNARGIKSLVKNNLFPVLESSPFSKNNLVELLALANRKARYVLFQETYDKDTYAEHHKGSGVKDSPDFRLRQIEKAVEAGWPEIGIGVLFGLSSDIEKELSCLVAHYEWLLQKGVEVVTISVPRINKAKNTEVAGVIDDTLFEKIVYAVRILCPKAKIVLTARETAQMRDLLKPVTHIWGVKGSTVPGGYTLGNKMEDGQFLLKDERFLEEID